MKLVVQFFNEEKGTRSDPISGTPEEILSYFDRIETELSNSVDHHIKFLQSDIADTPERSSSEIREEVQAYLKAAEYSLDRFLDSFVIVILEQHGDDADDMRVSRIPILKRENFIEVLKKKS
ncbi:MAG: hypothetical protein QXT77_09105 [Candidatus Methanomethylicaceae archaeon]